MQVGRTVAEAVGGSAGGGQKDLLSKNLDALTNAIFPYLEEDTKKRAAEVRRQLEDECSRGPLQVQVMQQPSKARRVRVGGGAKRE
jgi:hypothetical protein